MIQTTKRASERLGAEEEMARAAEHGRGRRACLERARRANMPTATEARAETEWKGECAVRVRG